eukprot:366321-Chlamydomonas_euryale.AAC.6
MSSSVWLRGELRPVPCLLPGIHRLRALRFPCRCFSVMAMCEPWSSHKCVSMFILSCYVVFTNENTNAICSANRMGDEARRCLTRSMGSRARQEAN